MIMLKSEIIMFLWLHNCGFTVQVRSLFIKASFSCLRQVKQEKWVWLVLVLCMTSNKVWILKWSGWAWPVVGSIFGLQGLKKRQEAPKSHCRPSPPPPPPCHLAFVLTWHLYACASVCTPLWLSLHLHPVLVACPWLHYWRQLMLSHGSIVAAPATNNQRQLFGKYQRCLIGSNDGLDSVFTLKARHAWNEMRQIDYYYRHADSMPPFQDCHIDLVQFMLI